MKKLSALKRISVFLLILAVTVPCAFAASAEEIDSGTVFDVTQFNATGDGVTDDGAAIQDAFDACNEAGGGTVYFPSGTYCISKTVFYYSNQKLIFEEGAVLKRIVNAESSESTCGVFLCNWFDTADTSSDTSATACVNAEIVGGTFDGSGAVPEDSPRGVAMINTCHAENVTVSGCKFINNYTAHCIELNSSQNVNIYNCTFSDYIGTEDTAKYNEMIQIDKSVNASLGAYIDSDSRVIRGYYRETMIDSVSPDCKASTDINIHGCTFYTNEYCAAVGNHHESRYATVNRGIKIYDNSFYGGAGDRGYLAFDNHTRDIEVYNNIFYDGTCGVNATGTDTDCIIHDNEFVGCKTAYSGSFVAYNNLIDGALDADGEDNALIGNMKSPDSSAPSVNSPLARLISFFEMLIDMQRALFGIK